MRTPCLSVIVSTTGVRRSLRDCLISVRASLDAFSEPSELLLVHNSPCPSDELRRFCETLPAKYVHEPVRGLSVARNRGVLAARGEFMAFTDDDATVASGWAGRLVAAFRSSGAEVVTGAVSAPESPDSAGGRQWGELYQLDESEPRTFDQAAPVPFFPLTAGVCGRGNNMAFRGRFLPRHGLFDPHFGVGSLVPGGEDIDRFYTVLRAGKTIFFDPTVRIEHAYEGDARALRKKIAGYGAAQAAFLLKCFVKEPAVRGRVAGFLWSRLKAVFRHITRAAPGGNGLPAEAPEARAPHLAVSLGSFWGPAAYAFSLLREAVWPRRTVVRVTPSHTAAPASSPSVLMILYNAGLGGAETIAAALASGLARRWNVMVVAPEAGHATHMIHAAGVDIGIIPRRRLRFTLNPLPHLAYAVRFPGTVASYLRATRACRPDLVHVDNFLNLPALVAARLSGVKAVLHLQEVPRGLPRKLLAGIAATLASRVVAVSQAAAAPLSSRFGPNLAIVPNGTPAPAAGGSRTGECGRIAFIGRLSEDKAPLFFIDVAAKVRRMEPSARFLICGVTVPGRGRYAARVERAIAAAGLAGALLLVRDSADVDEVLNQCSMVVNCSAVPEAFGLAVAEAIARGKAVVVPRWGAFEEFLSDGRTALFYTPGDPDGLVNCIVKLQRDPQLRERLGRAARSLVESRLTVEHMCSAMEREYRRVLGMAGEAESLTDTPRQGAPSLGATPRPPA